MRDKRGAVSPGFRHSASKTRKRAYGPSGVRALIVSEQQIGDIFDKVARTIRAVA
jgi:hypothetical protein